MQRAAMLIVVLISLGGCSRQPDGHRYTLSGQILAVQPEKQQVLITHDDIAGFMPAMTMTFQVRDPRLLKDQGPGDLVTGTLFVERPAGDPAAIIHNLRTAVVDPHGRIVKIYSGNEWTPAELLADLKAAASVS